MKDYYKSIPIWTAKIALFIVPFIPLYVSKSLFFPFITGKAFIFRFLVELAFFAWIFLAALYPEFRPRKTKLLWSVGFFILIVVLATLLGVHPYKSFWSNFERMEGLVAYLHLGAYFLVLSNIFKKKDWLIFFNLFVVSGLIQNFYALLQKIGYLASPQGGFRVDGTIGNATYVAAYLMFVLAIAALLLLTTQKKWAKYFYGFVGLWTLLTIYFTATRGAILALSSGIFLAGLSYLFLFKTKNERDKLYRMIIVAVLILLVAFGVGVKVFKNSDFIKNSEILSRISSISLAEGRSRFIIWNMGLQGFKERPILGWGPENYNVIFAKYYDPRLYSQEPWFDRSHNIIFDWLINAGILGLLAYLSIFITALYLLWNTYLKTKAKNSPETSEHFKISAVISILFFVYFLQNIFVFDQLATYLSFFAILAYIQGMASREERNISSKPALSFFGMREALLGMLIIFLVFVAYFINYKPLTANLSLLDAFKLRNVNDLDNAFGGYINALSYNTLGNPEIREHFAQFAIAVGAADGLDKEFKEKVFNRAVTEARETVTDYPLDPRPRLFLGALHSAAGSFDEAAKVFEAALELSPRKQQIHFELADVYVRQGNYKKALEILETAFNLEPRFDQARLNLAAVYILDNQQKKADELLIEKFGTADLAESILAQVYSSRRDYKRLLGIWQAFVKNDPKNVQYRKNVAAVYLELGKREEAILELEEAIKIDPSFKEEGETYIREISAGR